MKRVESRTKTLVLNGWAAGSAAWSLCHFHRDAIFSYLDQLNGFPERFISEMVPGERLILVGWSMGGSSALRLACAYPNRIAGLILIAATPRMMADDATKWRGMTPRRLEALRLGFKLTKGQGFFGLPDNRPNPYADDTDDHLTRGLDYLLKTDLREDLVHTFGNGQHAFPVSVFQSEHDGIVRPENALYLKSIFTNAKIRLIPGSEHALPIVIPAEIDESVASIGLFSATSDECA